MINEAAWEMPPIKLSCERFEIFDEGENRGAVPNIEFMVAEGGEGYDDAGLIPAGVSAGAKEVGPLIIVDAVDFLAEGGKEGDDFRADEA